MRKLPAWSWIGREWRLSARHTIEAPLALPDSSTSASGEFKTLPFALFQLLFGITPATSAGPIGTPFPTKRTLMVVLPPVGAEFIRIAQMRSTKRKTSTLFEVIKLLAIDVICNSPIFKMSFGPKSSLRPRDLAWRQKSALKGSEESRPKGTTCLFLLVSLVQEEDWEFPVQ